MIGDVVNLGRYRRRGGPFTVYMLPPDVVRVDRHSEWGNPFRISAFQTRAQAIARFWPYAVDRLIEQPAWLDPLEGRRLACHCAPLPCHAAVLVALRSLVAAARVVIRPDALSRWLATPAPILEGLTPRDVIVQGRAAEVQAGLEAIAAGTFT